MSEAGQDRVNRWAVAIGVFDGVHRGHQDLVQRMLEGAVQRSTRSACVTFDPDPELVLRPAQAGPALSSLKERIRWLRALGVDHVEVIPFKQEVAHLSPETFMARLLDQFEVDSVWVGSEFAFGYQRAGNVDTLREIGNRCGFTVGAVEPLTHAGRRISASWIRSCLAEGNVGLAHELLSRPYSLSGPVIPGMQRGRQLGFPTANVAPPPGRALPADGVYYVRAAVLGEATKNSHSGPNWPGVVNLGGRPTFAEYERLLETHLLDFQGDLYGQELEVQFLQQLRGIKKFENIEALRAQIERDVAQARELAAQPADPELPGTSRRS